MRIHKTSTEVWSNSLKVSSFQPNTYSALGSSPYDSSNHHQHCMILSPWNLCPGQSYYWFGFEGICDRLLITTCYLQFPGLEWSRVLVRLRPFSRWYMVWGCWCLNFIFSAVVVTPQVSQGCEYSEKSFEYMKILQARLGLHNRRRLARARHGLIQEQQVETRSHVNCRSVLSDRAEPDVDVCFHLKCWSSPSV